MYLYCPHYLEDLEEIASNVNVCLNDYALWILALPPRITF
uniref:Uncharacterized protein n=1 Tax=Rhizophora mucronata TaxID=61149 RepID=A0A2P2QJU4_RHIMU